MKTRAQFRPPSVRLAEAAGMNVHINRTCIRYNDDKDGPPRCCTIATALEHIVYKGDDMTVRPILPAPRVLGTSDLAEAIDRLDRLAATDAEHKDLALTFLSSYAPRVFDTIFDITEPPGTRHYDDDDFEPYCTVCGYPVGVFLAHGQNYRHYRGVIVPGSKPRPYKADHKPVVGWRKPAPAGEAMTR